MREAGNLVWSIGIPVGEQSIFGYTAPTAVVIVEVIGDEVIATGEARVIGGIPTFRLKLRDLKNTELDAWEAYLIRTHMCIDRARIDKDEAMIPHVTELWSRSKLAATHIARLAPFACFH